MSYNKIKLPLTGEKIILGNDGIEVPNNPIIPFIEGDGIGIDISPTMKTVLDAAVEKAYQGNKKIEWMEIYAGEKSVDIYGDNTWLPDETLDAVKEFMVACDCCMEKKRKKKKCLGNEFLGCFNIRLGQ